jgi:hypothetical protein
MFDLGKLDRAETLLRTLAGGQPLPARTSEPAPRAEPDLSRCPFHNGSLGREDVAA